MRGSSDEISPMFVYVTTEQFVSQKPSTPFSEASG